MQSVPVRQLKKTFRKVHLQRLRTWAKAEPAQLQVASQQLCDHLYNYIQARYRPVPPLPPLVSDHSSAGRAGAPAPPPPTPLFILAYLPLYYEVDLVPLMRRLWRTAPEQRIHILTPVVLPWSSSSATHGAPQSSGGSAAVPPTDPLHCAMAFVEVLDEEDLERTFAPQGHFQIREFPEALLNPWLQGPEAAPSPELAHCRTESLTGTREAVLHGGRGADNTTPGRGSRVRHVVLGDDYARLFPAAHAAGYRPTGLVDYSHKVTPSLNRAGRPVVFPCTASDSTTAQHAASTASKGEEEPEKQSLHLENVAMLVLAPGVLFDAQTGRRIGKGSGYYDRFLAYHARHHSSVAADAAAAVAAGTAPGANASTSSQGNAAAAGEREALLGDAVPRDGANGGNPLWEVMAVAFDSQVLRGSVAPLQQGAQPSEEIPVDEHDHPVHMLVSPSGGVETVVEKPAER